jgi:hypothetical protein
MAHGLIQATIIPEIVCLIEEKYSVRVNNRTRKDQNLWIKNQTGAAHYE